MKSLHIDLQDRSYPILIEEDLIRQIPQYLPQDLSPSLAVIVTNTTVAPLYGESLKVALGGRFEKILFHVLPDGEQFKTLSVWESILSGLLENHADRHAVIFALGGGVVGDMAGFAAASFMRGIPFIQVPTTLLAQVDSSVGGKTGINHELGKNMIGAFYQPRAVFCDLQVLKTLPSREISAGIAEIIKYGPIYDTAFLDWVDANVEALLALEPGALAHAVFRSCQIKAEVVGQDEKESGLRAILNFGHTFGHAIEAGLGYGQWLHGEAVGCGMIMASELSCRMGLVPSSFVDRMRDICRRAGLPIQGPRLGIDRYLELMQIDKKSVGGQIKFVLIDGVGRASVRSAPDELVRASIEACLID